jgi:TonB family protein
LRIFEPEQTEAERGPVTETATGPQIAVRRDLTTDVGELHLLIEELRDERSTARIREAMWISVVVHLVIFLLFILSPKIFPHWGNRVVLTPQVQDKNPTFLELPPDAQKYLTKRPKTNILSDKDRIAESKNPIPHQPTLEELERMRRQGRPGQQAQAQPRPQPQRPAPPQQQQMAQAQPQQQSQQGAAQSHSPSQPQMQQPSEQGQQSEAQQRPNPFATPQSAGAAIQDALRAAANGRGQGQAGDFGEGPRAHAGVQGNAEILSDTQGVDFGPYMARVVAAVRRNWYAIIPEEAGPPFYKTGRVIIEFSILKNGSIGGLDIRDGSGSSALDHAAKGGITASNPFPPLPSEYKGSELKLRFYFFYLGANGKVK